MAVCLVYQYTSVTMLQRLTIAGKLDVVNAKPRKLLLQRALCHQLNVGSRLTTAHTTASDASKGLSTQALATNLHGATL